MCKCRWTKHVLSVLYYRRSTRITVQTSQNQCRTYAIHGKCHLAEAAAILRRCFCVGLFRLSHFVRSIDHKRFKLGLFLTKTRQAISTFLYVCLGRLCLLSAELVTMVWMTEGDGRHRRMSAYEPQGVFVLLVVASVVVCHDCMTGFVGWGLYR